MVDPRTLLTGTYIRIAATTGADLVASVVEHRVLVPMVGLRMVDRRTVVEAAAWRFRTRAPWWDLPERFGTE